MLIAYWSVAVATSIFFAWAAAGNGNRLSSFLIAGVLWPITIPLFLLVIASGQLNNE